MLSDLFGLAGGAGILGSAGAGIAQAAANQQMLVMTPPPRARIMFSLEHMFELEKKFKLVRLYIKDLKIGEAEQHIIKFNGSNKEVRFRSEAELMNLLTKIPNLEEYDDGC